MKLFMSEDPTSTSAAMDDLEDEKQTVIGKTMDTALIPLHIATSRSAQKAYLGTALFAATSFFLLGIASVAFWLFYYNYLPQAAVERVIHLQFGNGPPHGITTFPPSTLASSQPYDITLDLHLPRTPTNLAAGNFMLDLSLLAPPASSPSLPNSNPNNTSTTTPIPPLAHSRRPAILTYTSPLTSTATTLTSLPWYLLGWKRESEHLSVPMFESVQFSSGKGNVPEAARVVVDAADNNNRAMQVYAVRVRIEARFVGVRWVLYRHRVFAFVVFTTGFWGCSVVAMIVVWVGLGWYFGDGGRGGGKAEGEAKVKGEGLTDSEGLGVEELNDAGREVLGLGGMSSLGGRGVKRESGMKVEDVDVPLRSLALGLGGVSGAGAGAEADDEAEADRGSWRDSGLGTGVDEDILGGLRRVRKRERGL